MIFCCCFCRATAVSTKKAEEGQDFVVGPHNPNQASGNSSHAFSTICRGGGGPHGQMAAEAGKLLAATAAPLATS